MLERATRTRATLTRATLVRAASTKEMTWRRGNPVASMILEEGIERFVARLHRFHDAFVLRDRTVRCIDEGTPGGIHVRGAGILLPFKDAKAWMNGARVDGVTSHAGCGGAKLFALSNNVPLDQVDECAIAHAKKLADALGVPYRGHIDAELQRPHEYHDARAVYVDGSGTFDPSRVSALPKGFTVSARYLSEQYTLDEVRFCITTALSEHGFGDRFTASSPFLVITVDAPAAAPAIATLIASYGGRVALVSCTQP